MIERVVHIFVVWMGVASFYCGLKPHYIKSCVEVSVVCWVNLFEGLQGSSPCVCEHRLRASMYVCTYVL